MRENWPVPVVTLAACGVLLTGGCASAATKAPPATMAAAAARTTPIVAGSGTGAYRGIRGSFPVTLTLNEVEATPCPGAFRAQLITVAGSGTVSF